MLTAVCAGNSAAFDFDVRCDRFVAGQPHVATYFQKFTGRWSGMWEKDEHLRLYPEKVQKTADRFACGQPFRIEVESITGCDIRFTVFYDQSNNQLSTYKTEVMTQEGFTIYWNSPSIDGTYILAYDENENVLEGVFQLFEGQNIARIKMKRF